MAGSQTVIEIRQLFQLPEFEEVLRLQQAIWGYPDIELLPLRFLVVVSNVGGHVFGAYDGDMMVGFCFAIPGIKPDGHAYLHSHMLGVLPAYRDAGIGRGLKLKQREEAMARGIDLIEWTFDPLELKNAFFNIERLGAIVRRYHENQYGITFSPLHGGLPTDRCYAEWWIASPRVAQLVGRTPWSAPDPLVRPAQSLTVNQPTVEIESDRAPAEPLVRPYETISHPTVEIESNRAQGACPVRPYETVSHPTVENESNRAHAEPPVRPCETISYPAVDIESNRAQAEPLVRPYETASHPTVENESNRAQAEFRPYETISYPAGIARLRAEDPRRARQIQKENGAKFHRAFEQGLAVTRFLRGEAEGSYLLEPWK